MLFSMGQQKARSLTWKSQLEQVKPRSSTPFKKKGKKQGDPNRPVTELINKLQQ